MNYLRIIGLGILALATIGCSKSEFPMAKVTGTVLCEGKPVVGAAVYFEPLKTAESAVVGSQSFSFTDKDGRFSLSVNGVEQGAVIGKHRVRVGGTIKDCPCSLNEEIDLMQVDVKEGTNDFELVLQKRKANERPPLVDDDDD